MSSSSELTVERPRQSRSSLTLSADEDGVLFQTVKSEIADELLKTSPLISRIDPHRNSIWRHFLFIRVLLDELAGLQDAAFSRSIPGSNLPDLLKVPAKLERTMFYGVLLCIDSLLYDITLMPISAGVGLLRYFTGFQISTTQRIDLLRFSLLFFSVLIFNLYVDFSVLYHYLRAQSLLKLYFIFNMLEILERLVRSWGSDLMDSLVAKVAERSADSSLAVNWIFSLFYNCVHAHVHFWRVLLVSVALVSADSSMFMIVLTNNFSEIKSVFKKYEQRSVYPLLCSDIVERIYLLIDVGLILFSLFTSPQKRRMPMGDILFWIAAMALLEVVTDWVKFLCISKFNELPSSIFDDFHRLHQADVVSVRSSDTVHAFKGVISFSHGCSRRLHFQALPLSALVLFHICAPTLAGTPASSVWTYRFLVFACFLVSKILLGVGIFGNALQAEGEVKEKLVSLKAL